MDKDIVLTYWGYYNTAGNNVLRWHMVKAENKSGNCTYYVHVGTEQAKDVEPVHG